MQTLQEQTDAEGMHLSDASLQKLQTIMEKSVADGLTKALNAQTAEMFWSAGFNMLQRQATEKTGKWLVIGISAVLKRVATFLLLGGLIYWIGGWSALATFFKYLISRDH
jgi:hypothetical protein